MKEGSLFITPSPAFIVCRLFDDGRFDFYEVVSHSFDLHFSNNECLPGESQGRWSLVGCRLWSHTESDTTEAT